MKILSLINGNKAYIAGFGLLLIALGQLLTHTGHCLTFQIDLQTCLDGYPRLWDALSTALMGLGIIGVRHGIAKNGTGQ